MKKIILLALTCAFMLTKNMFAQTVPDMIERSLSSVVTVVIYDMTEEKSLLGFRGATDIAYAKSLDLTGALGTGSGFVVEYNAKKYIITNAHVIDKASDKAGSIIVYSIDRTKYETKLVGGDSFYDLAVLEFISPVGKEISTLKFKTTESRVGEQVFAIGNPLGEYPYSVSDGIISAKNRVRGGLTGKFGFIQSTATVIWGNSGGPLIDVKGDVVGVNSQIAFAKTPDNSTLWQPQINFALESSVCQRIINDVLTNNGRVRRAYIGIEISQSYEQIYDGRNKRWELADLLPLITGTLPGSPAESDLKNKTGFAIIKVGDVETRNIEEVLGEFEKVKPGANIVLTLLKKGDNFKTTVNIKTTELAASHLETLASYQFSKDKTFKLSNASNGVWITYNPGYADRYENRQKRMYQGASTEWKIISAGLKTNEESTMWKVESLTDFGAALRLVGLSGYYNINVINKHDPEAQTAGIYISGNENVLQTVLWY
ncbi:MAG: trypsin-like peptidase domain-containing protein [Bacteroidia bacterium]